jgi:hypothetical protein
VARRGHVALAGGEDAEAAGLYLDHGILGGRREELDVPGRVVGFRGLERDDGREADALLATHDVLHVDVTAVRLELRGLGRLGLAL